MGWPSFGWSAGALVLRTAGEGIDVAVDRLGAAHPGLGPDAAHPVGEARDEAQIFADMLFADQADRHDAASRKLDRGPEEAFEHEDAFGVMAQGAMPEVGGDRLGFVEPLVERQIVLRRAAPDPLRGERVMIAMSHRRLLKTRAANNRIPYAARCNRA